MKKLPILLIIICSCLLVTFAQRQKAAVSRVLVDANKPTVYISFVGLKEIKPNDPNDERKRLFFRITNNTRWEIMLDASGVSKKEYGDASLYFAIEDKKDSSIISGSIWCHVCSRYGIGSGRSVVFSMPLNDNVSSDNRMRIAYTFDWEEDHQGSFNGSQLTHSVEFYFNSLPKSVLLPQ